MAETFWCGGERVKFSNGATELLFRHWLTRAETRLDVPGMSTVASFLHQRLTIGDGGRAFGMDKNEFPAELIAPTAASALAMLITETAADATQIAGITWDAHHREWWESRLQQLAQSLRAWQPPADSESR